MNITITTERPISRDGTYITCFITAATTQDRDVKAYSLNDVIAAGYTDTSPAYEFCRVYFSQKNKASCVLLKARYVGESLIDAFINGGSDYSFVCVDSKIESEIIDFSNFMLGKSKLFLYSGVSKLTPNRNTVWIGSSAIDNNFWRWDSNDDVLYFSGDFVQLEGS